MKVCLTCSNLRLRVGPGCEVTSPVLIRVVAIGEHVISLNGVAKILLLDSIQVSARGRIHHCDVRRVIVEVLDESVQGLKVEFSIGIGKVATHHNKHFVSLIDIKLFVNPSGKQIKFVISIEVFVIRICHSWLITAETVIKPENKRNKAISLGGMSEDLI